MSDLPPFGKRPGEAHIGVPVNEDGSVARSAPLLLYEAGTMRTPIFSAPRPPRVTLYRLLSPIWNSLSVKTAPGR
jgi:hypothetical protein